MHIITLFIIGLILLIGILIYYIVNTRPDGGSSYDAQERKKRSKDLKREDNVIFLPSDKDDSGSEE